MRSISLKDFFRSNAASTGCLAPSRAPRRSPDPGRGAGARLSLRPPGAEAASCNPGIPRFRRRFRILSPDLRGNPGCPDSGQARLAGFPGFGLSPCGAPPRAAAVPLFPALSRVGPAELRHIAALAPPVAFVSVPEILSAQIPEIIAGSASHSIAPAGLPSCSQDSRLRSRGEEEHVYVNTNRRDVLLLLEFRVLPEGY